MGGGVAQVRNAVRLVVHPIAISICQYLASSHVMATVKHCLRAINVVWMRRKKNVKIHTNLVARDIKPKVGRNHKVQLYLGMDEVFQHHPHTFEKFNLNFQFQF